MRRRVGAGLLTGAAMAVALTTLSACGSGGTQATTLAGSTAGSSASASSTAGNRAAYRDCLTQHGATLPSRAPGGGGGNASASPDPQLQAAMQACASLRPNGGGNNKGASALVAFRNCMSQQGEAIPTTKPTASPSVKATGDDRYLNGLSATDPKVAAALSACSALIPTHSPKPSDSASAMN
jgi:hypothetical protein